MAGIVGAQNRQVERSELTIFSEKNPKSWPKWSESAFFGCQNLPSIFTSASCESPLFSECPSNPTHGFIVTPMPCLQDPSLLGIDRKTKTSQGMPWRILLASKGFWKAWQKKKGGFLGRVGIRWNPTQFRRSCLDTNLMVLRGWPRVWGMWNFNECFFQWFLDSWDTTKNPQMLARHYEDHDISNFW